MDEISLKEYFERILEEKDKAINAALAAAKEAVGISQKNADTWREGANEWRGAMQDRERNFLSRKEFYAIVGTAVSVLGFFYLVIR